MRRVLLINPNTTASITDGLVDGLARLLGSGWHVTGVTARFGAPVIADQASFDAAAEAALDAYGKAGPAEVVVLGCFGDPGLDRLRAMARVPVTGLADAAFTAAGQAGRPFAVLTIGPGWAPILAGQLQCHPIGGQCQAIRTLPGDGLAMLQRPDETLAALDREAAALVAVGVDTLVLGGAVLAGLGPRLLTPARLIDPLVATAWLERSGTGPVRPGAHVNNLTCRQPYDRQGGAYPSNQKEKSSMSSSVNGSNPMPELRFNEQIGLIEASAFENAMEAHAASQATGEPAVARPIISTDGRELPPTTRSVVPATNPKTQEVTQRAVYSGQFDALPAALQSQLQPLMLKGNKDPEYNAENIVPVLRVPNKQIFVVTKILPSGNEKVIGMGASGVGHGINPDGSIVPVHVEKHLVGGEGSSKEVKEARRQFAEDAGAHRCSTSGDPFNETPTGAHHLSNNRTDFIGFGPIEDPRTPGINAALKVDINRGHGLPDNAAIDRPMTASDSPAMHAAAQDYKTFAQPALTMRVPGYDKVGHSSDMVRAELMPETAGRPLPNMRSLGISKENPPHKILERSDLSPETREAVKTVEKYSSLVRTFGKEANKEKLTELLTTLHDLPPTATITGGVAPGQAAGLARAAASYQRLVNGSTEQQAEELRNVDRLISAYNKPLEGIVKTPSTPAKLDNVGLMTTRQYPAKTITRDGESMQFSAMPHSATPLFGWDLVLKRNKAGVVETSDHPIGTLSQKGTFSTSGPHEMLPHPHEEQILHAQNTIDVIARFMGIESPIRSEDRLEKGEKVRTPVLPVMYSPQPPGSTTSYDPTSWSKARNG